VEYAKGDPNNRKSPYNFVEVRLNLPMSKDYDPREIQILLIDANGNVTGVVLFYIDDGRGAG
jgi:hypothetical protein